MAFFQLTHAHYGTVIVNSDQIIQIRIWKNQADSDGLTWQDDGAAAGRILVYLVDPAEVMTLIYASVATMDKDYAVIAAALGTTDIPEEGMIKHFSSMS